MRYIFDRIPHVLDLRINNISYTDYCDQRRTVSEDHPDKTTNKRISGYQNIEHFQRLQAVVLSPTIKRFEIIKKMAGGNSNKSDNAIPENEIFSCFTDTHGVITSTMNDLPGYKITKVLGTVYGLTVRSRNWGAGLGGIARSVVGGEIRVFTKLLYTARNEAVERMVGECMSRGGNALVAMRFDIVDMGGFSQICAYGTACLVEKLDD
ncbi:DUF74 domain protein [Talaromyces marneffei ATCC 18224]|uniref:DUF74 domain protein n=3 Tax=Talaromyces marneffei TaxID=37727 RepID=B6Q9Z8_TALMQ|nr:DUF74 domain protein [Talaromyces marneffei ATCC 18224]